MTTTNKKESSYSTMTDAFWDALALTVLRKNLNADGVWDDTDKTLATALGISRAKANRIMLRLIANKLVWLVSAATVKGHNGNRVPVNHMGKRATKAIFPWRTVNRSIQSIQPQVIEKNDCSIGNESMYSYVLLSLSVGVNGVLNPLSIVSCSRLSNQPWKPPVDAVERQIVLAKERLQRLESEQGIRLKRLEGRDWTTPVEQAYQDIAWSKNYIADLETWGRDISLA
jgi:hypothetical protein